jgi:hypothetical protein
MMASQLGAVTVSSVPDEQSGEVGGLQNTGTTLGASIGTALAGALLIAAMTASFFTGIQNNPNVPDRIVSQAQTQLASGVPFISEADAQAALKQANVPPRTADEIVKQYKKSQIGGLRAAEAILVLLALIALPFTRGIPTVQPRPSHRPIRVKAARSSPRSIRKIQMANDRTQDSVSRDLGPHAEVIRRSAGTAPRLVAGDVVPAWVVVGLERAAPGKRSCEAGRRIELTIHHVVDRGPSTVLTAHHVARRT